MSKGGRPTTYSQEMAYKICERIALGDSLRKILRDNDDMPAMSTVWLWLNTHEEFSKQYVQACNERAESHNELLLDLGDEAIELAQSVDPKSSSAVVQAVKLKADNLRWAMSKQKPKKFGEKLDVTSDGQPLTVNVISYADNTTSQVRTKTISEELPESLG